MKKLFVLSVLLCFLVSSFTAVKAFEVKNEKQKIEKTSVDVKAKEVAVQLVFIASEYRNFEKPKPKLEVVKEAVSVSQPYNVSYHYCRNQDIQSSKTIFKE